MYRFYYDETEHSRRINQGTVLSENYYDSFVTAIVGWDESKETEIERRYLEFEAKYEDRKQDGELKSTAISQKNYKYGFASMWKENLDLIRDFLETIDENVYLYFSVQSKLEYVICQLFKNYKNSLLVDMDAFKYSLIKAIHTYRPANVFDSMYNHPNDLVYQIREFLADQIEKNRKNELLKARETEAFIQNIILLQEVDEINTIAWDYHMPFDGFSLFLKEQGIKEYSITLDEEGSEHNTLNSAKDMGHVTVEEKDSKLCFGIRFADMIVGIIARFMKSLSEALASTYEKMQKQLLDDKWFCLSEEQHDLYVKLHHVINVNNDGWYKSYAGLFADDLVAFVELLNYMNNKSVDELKQAWGMNGEYYNAMCVDRLETLFQRMHNKLRVEHVSLSKDGSFINKWGAKVYTDIKKQPELVIDNDQGEFYVKSVGIDKTGIPTVTIEENGKHVCYRISEQLSGWAQTVIALQNYGEKLVPSWIRFTIRNNKWYADLL